MKFKEALEMGKECGLLTAREAVTNVQIHAPSLFVYEKITEELCELAEEYKAFSSLYPRLFKVNECLEKFNALTKFTKEELITEAECVEECGEWIHMSLMGYKPETLRRMAIFAS